MAGGDPSERRAGRTDVAVLRFPAPALATVDLAGRVVHSAAARGKHLFIRLDGDLDNPPLSLHSHFRMDGAWHLYRPAQRWRGGPAYQVRVVLGVPDRLAVGYRLHDVTLVPSSEERCLVGHLGPDVLGSDWDPDEAVRRLAAHPSAEIGQALLDQRNLAGIGNLYKSEVLFLSGITPWTPVGELTGLPAMVALAHRLMRANRDRPEQATTGSVRRGEQQWVFERAGRPCRRCGTQIRMHAQATTPGIAPADDERSRLSYWCPRCQRGPAPALGR